MGLHPSLKCFLAFIIESPLQLNKECFTRVMRGERVYFGENSFDRMRWMVLKQIGHDCWINE